jgi:iron complex transport system permease protein
VSGDAFDASPSRWRTTPRSALLAAIGMTKRIAPALFLAVAVPVTLAASALALMQGPAGLGVGDVLRGLVWAVGLHGGDPQNAWIVVEIRLPRVLVALLAGASLAIAGAIMQAVFRNPLASPEIMGTSAGAALGAVLAIAGGLAATSSLATPAAAFAGAGVVSVLVYLAAAGPGGLSVTGLLLAGIAMNTLVGALTAFVIALFSRHAEITGPVLFWLMGGLETQTMQNAAIVGGGVVVFGLGALPFVRDMDLLTLRDESAASLGVDVGLVRQLLLLVACGLTATAVSCTGGIVFVGLVVPHMVRLLVGPAHRGLLPCAAVTGALVLVGADAVVKLLPQAQLRLGVVTSLIGAPFFLHLLVRHRRGGRL